MVYKTKEITTPNSVYEQPKQQSHFYKGFSSIGTNVGNTQLFDFELIKQDILNHFNTKKGERVMNPEFGSLIWDLLMEPLTDQTRELLKNDISTICTSDPRVTPIQMDLTEFETGYILELTLALNNTNQSSSMKLMFDQKLGLTVQ
jgi:phage baseplate assembly protein W